MTISVIVYTKNEAQDLPGCLMSLSWSDDIHVYDSGSSDETEFVARKFGVNFIQKKYANDAPFGGDESAHRCWGLRNIKFKYPWVYHSDADERTTPELVQAMKQAVSTSGDCVAFRVKRRDYLDGRWLKYVTPSPFNVRLFKPEKIRYDRLTNPVIVVDGLVGDIPHYFDHFPFSKGMSHWVAKHNHYSSLEAEQIIQNKIQGCEFSVSKAFFCNDQNERRFHQKELFYRLPMRPLFMFFLVYFGKFGFLDGRAGFKFAILRSIYEYFIVHKVRELELKCPVEKAEQL